MRLGPLPRTVTPGRTNPNGTPIRSPKRPFRTCTLSERVRPARFKLLLHGVHITEHPERAEGARSRLEERGAHPRNLAPRSLDPEEGRLVYASEPYACCRPS